MIDRCPTCGSERQAGSPGGLCPRCLLRIGLSDAESDPGDGGPPPGPTEAPEAWGAVAPRGDRFLVLGEIARGGMGRILRGRDLDLDRDVAIKVLHERHRDRPELVRRFVQEARIAGRLQHPGVVPVYEVGTLVDRRPYIAMKLVRGRTLAGLFATRPDPARDRPRLLAIFLQVVQAMAFAHSRGVVHRDLTPSNVMVGEHGEVQVMDWGLARVLGRGGRAGGDGPEPRALASEPPMGTPGYMAPEQMTGAMARADERTDVFGLGSILCELLTGSPAYDGQAARAGKDRATPIDLAGAHTRLMACGADGELIALARTCLAVDPACRPRDAGEVETRLTAYLDGVRERLRRAELERVEAQARAAEERTRRRLAVALTAALLTLVTLGGVGGALYARHRLAQWSRTASILREVDRLRAAAAADPAGAVAPWSAAQEAVRLARTQLDPTPASIRARLEGLAGQVERGLAAAEADRRLLRELELPRARSGERELGEADAAYAAAFGADGLDVDRRDPAELGRILARRPAAVTQAVVAALDDWSIVRRNRPDIEAVAPGRWRRPQEAARAADPDPWRNALRDALGRNDRAAYARLAEADGLERRPAPSLWLLGRALIEAGEPGRAAAVLQRAWRAYPTDFWINLDLSHALAWSRPPRFEDGDRFATAAVALRPESSAAHVGLALSLHRRGDRSGAEAEYREALRLRPDYAMGHYNLGNLLADMERLDEAIAAYRAAMRGNHNVSANAHVNLGSALIRLGRLDEAAAELREVTRSRPNLALAWSNLSLVLKQLGDTEGAARADRRAADLGLPARDPGASTPGPSR